MRTINNGDKEIYYVQNPSLGAVILWRFTCGYYNNGKEYAPFPLLFIVLPFIFRYDLCEIVTGTQKRSGLSKVSEKLFSSKTNDRLYYIHYAAEEEKELTLKAIQIAHAARLFVVDKETALVMPLAKSKMTGTETIKKMLDAAEKLGSWCADLTMHEISSILKVRF